MARSFGPQRGESRQIVEIIVEDLTPEEAFEVDQYLHALLRALDDHFRMAERSDTIAVTLRDPGPSAAALLKTRAVVDALIFADIRRKSSEEEDVPTTAAELDTNAKQGD